MSRAREERSLKSFSPIVSFVLLWLGVFLAAGVLPHMQRVGLASADQDKSARPGTAKGRPADPKLEFAFSVQITLSPKLATGGVTQGGDRAYVGIVEGTFEGPKLKGKVLTGGGDWAHVRPDGVLDFDARYMLQEDDGTIIYIQNRGFRWGSKDVMDRLAKHQPVADSEYYMRTSPRFEVRPGPHDWLAKYVFVGVGEKTPTGNIIRYYKVL